MTDGKEPAVTATAPPGPEIESAPTGESFAWHPVYKGKRYQEVERDLAEEIARDQRTYGLAMDGAEGAEHDALKSVVDLERRWSQYDFDWVEANPNDLAARITLFEVDREQRKEMRSFADFRSTGVFSQPEVRQPVRSERSLPIVPIGVAVLAVLVLVFILIIVL